MTEDPKHQPISEDNCSVQTSWMIQTTIAQQFVNCTLFYSADTNVAKAFTASTFRQGVRQCLAGQFTSLVFRKHS